jgi:hypothetical protein
VQSVIGYAGRHKLLVLVVVLIVVVFVLPMIFLILPALTGPR